MAAHVHLDRRLQTKRTAWKALETHCKRMRDLHLRNLFRDDPTRGQRMTAQAVGFYLDYSKNCITDHTLQLLIDLAEESSLQVHIDAMFRGDKINITDPSVAWWQDLQSRS